LQQTVQTLPFLIILLQHEIVGEIFLTPALY